MDVLWILAAVALVVFLLAPRAWRLGAPFAPQRQRGGRLSA